MTREGRMGVIDPRLTRRAVLRGGARAFGVLGLTLFGNVVAVPLARSTHAEDFGPLQAPDANGLRLPVGFRSRIVARTGEKVSGSDHVWHAAPDGGATFPTDDGGWVYVSNSERAPGGGVGAIRFAADGTIVDAYPILTGTRRNCAGGPTPWGSWLSCEEVPDGRVYECDPLKASQGVLVPSLGTFNHEAAAIDPLGRKVYLTEDRRDGRLYRFVPASYPSLASGTLEVAEILDPAGQGAIRPGQVRGLRWHPLAEADPAGGGVDSVKHRPVAERATRYQVAASTAFDGGEGCWYGAGKIYFSTKGDDRVWELDPVSETISIFYDRATSKDPVARNLDNLYVARNGDVYVAEDPGRLQIVALSQSGAVKPVVRITGVSGTELTGPALSPDGTRLYFSSQRNPGATFEVTGPFAPAPAQPGSDA